MRYSTAISMVFPQPRTLVYAALVNLKRYPEWNSGMISVSPDGPMSEGMVFHSKSIVMGKSNQSTTLVLKLAPHREIVLVSETGAIAYKAWYKLSDCVDGGTLLEFVLHFEPNSIVIRFAHSVIEAMAKARITGDLESLRAVL